MIWNKERTLLVTGASGHLGRRVVEVLLDAEERVVAATRTPEKLSSFAARGAEVRRADFDDPRSLDRALTGIDRLLLISTDALGGRVPQHLAVIDAAVRAGVEHVVYTSFSNPEKWKATFVREHVETEAALAASGLGWTVLRNNLYTDYLVPKLSSAIASGELEAAAGGGGAGYVTRSDCAGAAAAALASAEFDGRTIDVTGPAVVTHAELARIAGEVSRTRVAYAPKSPEEIRKHLIAAGISRDRADVLVSIDEAVANGWFQTATNAVEELTGHPPASVSEFLGEHSDVLFSGAEPTLARPTSPVGARSERAYSR
ncbi:MAG TPA: SDR family oxidoreductase [Thermoanaerobaculia bacterium]|jgi:NAD(P)H dehydrogenase (quinone)|nr:SDR family oxidoreductase [Thermoanaerobaculia bacterium]